MPACPRIEGFEVLPNCGQDNDGISEGIHHCARGFVVSFEVKGLTTPPTIAASKAPVETQTGVFEEAPLECVIRYGSSQQECVVLNLGIQTTGERVKAQKPAVGLQFCKPGSNNCPCHTHRNICLPLLIGGMKRRFAWVEWCEETMTATIHLMFRARRVHAHAIEDRWEFRDDAGSGIRGKPHTESAFRFTAFLDNGVDARDDLVYQDIRVWSKGNCPDRKRKISQKKKTKKR
jgi:hypothetical protein